jgi:hypothetical protein
MERQLKLRRRAVGRLVFARQAGAGPASVSFRLIVILRSNYPICMGLETERPYGPEWSRLVGVRPGSDRQVLEAIFDCRPRLFVQLVGWSIDVSLSFAN